MKIVIVGAGAVGTHLSKLLSRERQDCVLIDDDDERLSKLSEYDVMTYQALPTSIKALKEAGAQHADLFVGVTPEESTNMNACILAHALGAKKTVARIDNYEYLSPELQPFFKNLGIDSLIYPEVKDLCGPNDPYHIVAIKRGGDTLIPGGMDELHVNDLAYFMTTKEYIPYIRKIVGKEHYEDVKNVIIMGGGKTAVRAALAIPNYMNLKIIEKDAQRCEKLNELLEREEAMIIHGDGRDLSLLEEEGIRHTQAFVALTGNAETNILACLTAKKLGVRKTIAMVENLDYVSMAESLDIGTIINKKTIAASHIFQMMLDADVDNLRSLMLVDADVAEFTAAEGSKVTKKPVKDLGLPFGATIGGLVRNGAGMLVNGNSQIQAGDSVMVFCHEQKINLIEKFFKKNAIW